MRTIIDTKNWQTELLNKMQANANAPIEPFLSEQAYNVCIDKRGDELIYTINKDYNTDGKRGKWFASFVDATKAINKLGYFRPYKERTPAGCGGETVIALSKCDLLLDVLLTQMKNIDLIPHSDEAKSQLAAAKLVHIASTPAPAAPQKPVAPAPAAPPAPVTPVMPEPRQIPSAEASQLFVAATQPDPLERFKLQALQLLATQPGRCWDARDHDGVYFRQAKILKGDANKQRAALKELIASGYVDTYGEAQFKKVGLTKSGFEFLKHLTMKAEW